MIWVALALMGSVALAAILWPFVRRPVPGATRAEHDLVVLRAQLAEIDRDLDRGLLTDAAAHEARRDVERRALAATAGPRPSVANGTGHGSDDDGASGTSGFRAGRSGIGRAASAGMLACGLLASALAVYVWLGSPGTPSMPLASRLFAQRTAAEGLVGPRGIDLGDTLSRLQQRVREVPNDIEGWRWYGRILAASGQFTEAAAAYRQALRLPEADAPFWTVDLTASLGEVLVQANDGVLVPEAVGAFQIAIETHPGDPRARFYLALADAQIGRLREALRAWVDLAADSRPDAPWTATVRDHIREAANQLGLDGSAILASIIPQAPAGAGVSVSDGPGLAPGLAPGSAPGSAMTVPAGEPGREASGMASRSGGEADGGSAMPPRLTEQQMALVNDMSAEERKTFIRSMVERLQGRLESDPNDLEGWLRLIPMWVRLEERGRAQAAFDRAWAVHTGDDGARARLEALALSLQLEPSGS